MITRTVRRSVAARLSGIVAGALLVLVPMTALADAWTITPSPNDTGSITGDQLSGTSCASSTMCWAVGQYLSGTGTEQTLIEGWDGTSWAIVGSPNNNDGGTQSNTLNSVTCVSSIDCWAVGEHGSGIEQTLIENWNGGSWTLADSPSASGSQPSTLDGVTCESSTQCWAVGWYRNDTPAYQTLIEKWDGTSWAIVASPNTGSSEGNVLDSVACASSTQCWAVGRGPQQPLIEVWNGIAWTIAASPSVGASLNDSLLGVTCVSATDCWAVGVYYAGANGLNTLAERWDGAAWTVVSTPNATTTLSNILGSVTCLSSTDCWATGEYNTTGGSSTLVEQWNGSNWTIVPSPDVGSDADRLLGVSCVSSTDCWSAGVSALTGTATDQTLIERWDGSSWTITASPNGTGTTIEANTLADVSCVTASECWAVGGHPGQGAALIEEWQGSSWKAAPAPNSPSSELYGVSCVSSTDCWAVGEHTDQTTGYGQTLIEVWDGVSWNIVASPDTSTAQDNVLNSVACSSSSECWAVGSYRDRSTGISQTLIEEWTGSVWTMAPSPNTSTTQTNLLSSVTCASAFECWAVGSGNQTLIEEWNGGSWAIVSSADIGTAANGLAAVTCSSSTVCWAVGTYDTSGGGYQQTLIEKWDGVSWAIATSPNHTFGNGNLQNNDLLGVTCASSSDCWAVGTYAPTYDQTLVEQWDGTSWSIASSPDSQGPGNSALSAASCVSSSECWAVGEYTDGNGPDQTLVEEWRGHQLPSIQSITPAAGPVTGGQAVTVTGSGFLPGMAVTLGGVTVSPSNVTATSFRFTTPAGVSGLTYVTVTVAIGTSAENAGAGYVYVPLASYFPLSPFRILDTRSGALCTQCAGGKLGQGVTRTVQITGVSGLAGGADLVPPTASAVVLNVTAVGGSAASLLTVYPAGTAQPRASNLNFSAGTATSNLVTVALGQMSASDSNREINIFNALGSVDVVADVQGYFGPQNSTSPIGEFHPIAPLRVCDTRARVVANPCNGNGGASGDNVLGAGGVLKVNVSAVTGQGGSIPGSGMADAAVVNLTAVSGNVATYLSMFPTDAQGHCTIPGGGGAPRFSTLNVGASTARANRVMVPLGPDAFGGTDSDVCVYNALGRVNVVIDANGWYGSAGAATGKQYQAIGPSRICDTRTGSATPCAGRELVANGVDTISVAGVGGVPATGAVGVILNLTAVGGTEATFLTLYPANLGSAPLASDLNVGPNTALPNLAVVQLDTSGGATTGKVKLFNALGRINAVLDVDGWFQ